MPRGQRWRTVAWRALFACLLLVMGPVAATAAEAPIEVRVKAAFVYKFGDYVEWPAGTFARGDSPLEFGVVGADALADELARLTVGRKVGGRAITVRKLAADEAWTGLHVVFIGGGDASGRAAALAAGAGRPVLTITQARDGEAGAGMINLVVEAGKVRFDVALPAGEAARLKIRSRLLAVARTVQAP